MKAWKTAPIDVEEHGAFYVSAVAETYRTSFGSDERLFQWAGPDGSGYLRKLEAHATTPNSFCRTLMVEDQPVGLVEAYPASDDKFYLALIYVGPEMRGTGIARQIHAALLEFLKKADFKKISLTVEERNSRAASFYEQNGWQLIGRSDKSPSALIYEREL